MGEREWESVVVVDRLRWVLLNFIFKPYPYLYGIKIEAAIKMDENFE